MQYIIYILHIVTNVKMIRQKEQDKILSISYKLYEKYMDTFTRQNKLDVKMGAKILREKHINYCFKFHAMRFETIVIFLLSIISSQTLIFFNYLIYE